MRVAEWRGRLKSGIGTGLSLTLGFMLSGCSVHIDPAVSSVGDGIARGSVIEFVGHDRDLADQALFRSSLSQSFQDRAVSVGQDASVYADFALAFRRKREGIADDGPSGAANGGEVNWVSRPARKQRIFDKCQPTRMRGTLALFSRESGDVLYRGTGEADACAFSDEDVAQMAGMLVADAVRD